MSGLLITSILSTSRDRIKLFQNRAIDVGIVNVPSELRTNKLFHVYQIKMSLVHRQA
jgi:hypothetical protein